MKKQTILIFTGGGLAPALNPTLYGVISEARKNNFKVLGGLFGWASLLRGGKIIDLNRINIEPIKKVGGTFLRSSRTNPLKQKNGLKQVEEKLRKHSIDCVVAIGGDDTLTAAYKLSKDGVKIVGIPKTIDNDLQATYFSPGFPSAAFYIAQFTEEIKMDAAYALSRIFVIESLGRKSGWVAASSVFGGADLIVPPERKIGLNHFLRLLEKKYKENCNFATVVVSEEAIFDKKFGVNQDQQDQFGVARRSFVALNLKKTITKKLGIDCKALFPGNFIQTGVPIKIDIDFAIRLGRAAVNLVKQKKYGRMVVLKRPNWKSEKIVVRDVSLKESTHRIKVMDNRYFDFKSLQVKKKFLDYMKSILGDYKVKHSDYYRLIEKVCRY